MQLPIINQQGQKLTCPRLPLAVYLEAAAHLRQVEGVEASLILRPIEHQPGTKFDYYQSQVAALQIDYAADIAAQDKQRITEILDYYAQRYHSWEPVLKDTAGHIISEQ